MNRRTFIAACAGAAARCATARAQEPSAKSRSPELGLAHLACAVRPDFLLGSGGLEFYTRERPIVEGIFKRDFNIIQTCIHMDQTQPQSSNSWDFTTWKQDEQVEFARSNNIAIYLHALIYGSCLPDWFKNGTFTALQLEQIMKDRITTILTRYAGKVKYVDVVNEVLFGVDATTGNIQWNVWDPWMKMGWYNGKQYQLPKHVVEAFRTARAVGGGNLKLICNDYGNATPNSQKTEAMFKFYNAMKYEGIPIDGVGLEMHMALMENGDVVENGDRTKNGTWTPEKFYSLLKRFENAGIDVHITEFDVHMQQQPPTADLLKKQAAVFRQVLRLAIQSPAVKSFKTWEVGDEYAYPVILGYPATPNLFDKEYTPKPAYKALVRLLETMAREK
jgi:endo-1,4-beta-xylanase